jgi:hypothetical protein
MTWVTAHGQLADGSLAPDWTLTDINGNEHHLYDYLDNGYTVFLDLSATWCGPCWSHHIGGSFEELYVEHGPLGFPGVSSNTTDDVMVFHIEVDPFTGINALNGIGGGTIGNWVAGTPYPIINDHTIADDYNVNYFPSLYRVCENKRLWQIYPNTADIHYIFTGACPSPVNGTDAEILSYTGPSWGCGSLPVEIVLHNLGTQTLTSRSFNVLSDGQLIDQFTWSGSLPTFNHLELQLGEIYVEEDTEITVVVQNDLNNSNNDASQLVSGSSVSGTPTLTIEVGTDCWPSETRWRVEDIGGDILASGGPYSAGGQVYTHTIDLPEDGCFRLVYSDSFGDGMNGTARGCAFNGFFKGYFSDESENPIGWLIDYNGSFQTGNIAAAFTVGPDGQACLGDFDEDSFVAVSDLLVLLSEFGCQTNCSGDLNDDGSVSTPDLLIFLGLYGTQCQ